MGVSVKLFDRFRAICEDLYNGFDLDVVFDVKELKKRGWVSGLGFAFEVICTSTYQTMYSRKKTLNPKPETQPRL